MLIRHNPALFYIHKANPYVNVKFFFGVLDKNEKKFEKKIGPFFQPLEKKNPEIYHRIVFAPVKNFYNRCKWADRVKTYFNLLPSR